VRFIKLTLDVRVVQAVGSVSDDPVYGGSSEPSRHYCNRDRKRTTADACEVSAPGICGSRPVLGRWPSGEQVASNVFVEAVEQLAGDGQGRFV